MSKPKTVTLHLHRTSTFKRGSLPRDSNLENLRPEIIAVLEDNRTVLENLLRIDLEHNWGYAQRFNERIARIDELLNKLGVFTMKLQKGVM